MGVNGLGNTYQTFCFIRQSELCYFVDMGGRFRSNGFEARWPYVICLFAHPMVIMILDVGLSCGESLAPRYTGGGEIHQSGAMLSSRACLTLVV